MKTIWNKGLNEKDSQLLRENFVQAKRFRARLVDILQDKITTADKSMTMKDGYDTPNWDLKVADCIGSKRAYNEIINLIEKIS
jgi:hypothetical protein